MSEVKSMQIEVFAIHNDQKLESVSFQKLINILSFEERQKNERFFRWQDAQSNLLGRLAIRKMACERFGIGLKEMAFSENDYGKPCFKSVQDFHFNISHSNDWIVVVGYNSPVGIDIEMISPIDLGIAGQFFSAREYEELMSKPLDQRKGYFFDLWTLKESYIKADGQGLSIPLNSFSIIKEEDEIQGVGLSKNYFFKQYNIDSNYKLSVCALTEDFPDTVRVIDVDRFIVWIFDHLSLSDQTGSCLCTVK